MRPLVIYTLLACAAPALAAPVDFDHDIRPIFAQHCYECHGTDKAKGGLRLNDQKIAFGELKSGAPNFKSRRAGVVEIKGDNILLGTPFIFNKDNIDQFDF